MVKFIGQNPKETEQRKLLNKELVPKFSKLLKPDSKLVIVGSGINWDYTEDFSQCEITKTEINSKIPGTMYDDICNSKIGQKYIDAVLFNGMWEVVNNPFDAIWNVYLMLKTHGYLLFGAPFKMNEGNTDYWRITPSGVDKLLDEHGFKILEKFNIGEEYTYAIAQKHGKKEK